MTLRDLNILKDVLCVQDDDYAKPCISPEYLEHELEELFVMIDDEGGKVGMTDREQVIEELKYMKRDALEGSDKDRTLDKAIALLKEQEAVKPILIRERRNKYYNDYACPRCNNEIVYEQIIVQSAVRSFCGKGSEVG